MTTWRLAQHAVTIALLVAWTPAHGQCRTIEYAELDAMRPDQLLRMRCEYRESMLAWLEIATKSASRSVYAAQSDLATANRCAQEMERLDRLLGRKLPIAGDDATVARTLNATCLQGKR